MDVTAEELFDAIDAIVRATLERANLAEPPVDALVVAQTVGLRVEFTEPDEFADNPREYGQPARRKPPPGTIVLRFEQTVESQHAVAARAVAKKLVPDVLAKVGIVPGTEQRSAANQLAGQIVPRLLLPTRWFAPAARRADFDLLELKQQFPTAAFDFLLLRLLDVADDPLVVAMIEDDAVALRRANQFPVTKVLTAAEAGCRDKVLKTNKPARHRADDWTAWGWPVPGPPFLRVLLRACPDEF